MKTPIAPASILGGSSESRRAATQFLNRLVWLGTILLLAGLCLPAHAQTGQWAWMGGSGTGTWGVYGTLGTPAPGNIPGARRNGAVWTDSSGNFWLFGGFGVDSAGGAGWLNDLWKFNPSTNEWTWMGGSSTTNVGHGGLPGVYGTLRTPAPCNIPGTRDTASSWTDSGGNLWLFGGQGMDGSGDGIGYLNDLWEFNPSTNEWAWMSGSAILANGWGQPGIYGTRGTPAAKNTPGSRFSAASWTDSIGNLWLFGGSGLDSATDNSSNLNDLWEFNPSTNEWTWMGGSDALDLPAVYGSLGTPAAQNTPGGREDQGNRGYPRPK